MTFFHSMIACTVGFTSPSFNPSCPIIKGPLRQTTHSQKDRAAHNSFRIMSSSVLFDRPVVDAVVLYTLRLSMINWTPLPAAKPFLIIANEDFLHHASRNFVFSPPTHSVGLNILLNWTCLFFHWHVWICCPLINRCLVVSNFIKANGSEDRAKVARSHTHSSVNYKIVFRCYPQIHHNLYDFFR
ncbi:hypothetical protein DSOL_1136 [Desulfosporosinus metallidurans]|uniref:Uncharacterized protein n=1 Tax=Desulfosporosinus metallidurans TaxID=1888891 RepID=A0A1Q8R0C2_9FIRM|nr:hypothetical protein DSOL_1136 [Desulfosporosinus metallidurans]